MVSAFTEDQAIKSAVENIAQRAGHDQRETPDQSRVGRSGPHPVKVNPDDDYSNDPEDAQHQFAGISSEGKTECHPFIFSKMKDKPIACHMNLVPDRHMGLDPELQHLVGDQHQENNKDRFLQGLLLV